jgi:hypothetical protein
MNDNRLTKEFLEAKQQWQDASFDLHRARAVYDYAEKRLWLARDQLVITAMGSHDPQSIIDVELAVQMRPVAYLGKPIRQAAQEALFELGAATAEHIANYMKERGFQFSGVVPVREVHGALVKQPWASRNRQSGEWEYVSQ